METQDLSNIKLLYETKYISEANRYLELGWILHATNKTCYDPVYSRDDQTLHYVLAWNKDDPPAYPKDEYQFSTIPDQNEE